MEQHNFKFTIEAKNIEEARKTAEALSNIYKNVENSDLIKLSNAVVKNPSIVKKALTYLKFL
jgi:hypothetical protein